MRINVLEHGLISSREINQSTKLQKLIDESPKGSEIYFPKGEYLFGSIILKSDLTINIAEGATILGDVFNSFLPSEKHDYPQYQDQSHGYFQPSLFLGMNVSNVTFTGKGTIDMQSMWDEENVRDIVHRGAKAITFVESKNLLFEGISVLYATDLALYFVSSENIVCRDLYLDVYIDGISPDNCKHVEIYDCEIHAGDDGIVLKSTYNLNKLDFCKDIHAHDCKIKSRCNCVKIGTETNGGFYDCSFKRIKMWDTRITGISLETVDGAHIENFVFEDIEMDNIGAPIYCVISDRLRGPEGTKVGSMKHVLFKNIKATGPYHVYEALPWNYITYAAKSYKQFPGQYSKEEPLPVGTWQTTSVVTGMDDHKIEDITFENIYFEMDGGVLDNYPDKLPKPNTSYPEITIYGRISPAYGMIFKNIKGLKTKNLVFKTYNKDNRPEVLFENIED